LSIKDEVAKLIGSESAGHKRLIEYVVRQLGAGRDMAAVLDDPYVTNRSTHMDRRALLEEPEVIAAAGGELEHLRAQLEEAIGH
jgi:Ni2+-binding GTPase involved in maturation of urease and hydrogenase